MSERDPAVLFTPATGPPSEGGWVWQEFSQLHTEIKGPGDLAKRAFFSAIAFGRLRAAHGHIASSHIGDRSMWTLDRSRIDFSNENSGGGVSADGGQPEITGNIRLGGTFAAPGAAKNAPPVREIARLKWILAEAMLERGVTEEAL